MPGADHLLYGVDGGGRAVALVGGAVYDLQRFEGLDVDRAVFSSGSLNAFMALGRAAWERTSAQILASAAAQKPEVSDSPPRGPMRLPVEVADYVDFYSSLEHASNMGRMLRPGEDPLPPAWRHLPIGYHGRSGSVIVSGEPVRRPEGILGAGRFGPTERLDVEVELGFVVGTPVPRGRKVSADQAADHIFGALIVNDWSARDIQAFEYRPLGPFLGKSFATSVSAWVIPFGFLDRVDGPGQEPPPAAYLRQSEPRNVDVRLRLSVNSVPLSCTTTAGLYWSAGQQLAHLTVGGSGLRTGDLFATGTISGPDRGSEGSLMELFAGGRFLADGDVVTIEGWTAGGNPLGEVTATVQGASG